MLGAEFDRAVGIDASPELTAIAKEVAPTADVLTGDLRNVCLEPCFDAVVMLGRVLAHSRTNEETTDVLANCFSHLSPGGVVAFGAFDRRGIEDGHEITGSYASEDYRVDRAMTAFVTDFDAGRWGFDAEYTVTDLGTGEMAVAEQTMHLRAHLPETIESILVEVGYTDVSFEEESASTLRAAARKPQA